MTQTNLDSYVNGHKVVGSDSTTVTLETGVTIDKDRCRHVSTDPEVGATYYRYDETERTRIKLAVYIDLDPTPGEFHSAESARNVVGAMLKYRIGHYNPTVSIESYDTQVQPLE